MVHYGSLVALRHVKEGSGVIICGSFVYRLINYQLLSYFNNKSGFIFFMMGQIFFFTSYIFIMFCAALFYLYSTGTALSADM